LLKKSEKKIEKKIINLKLKKKGSRQKNKKDDRQLKKKKKTSTIYINNETLY
jgi:hypothetical protein